MRTNKVATDAKALFAAAVGLILLAVLIDSEAVAWLVGPVVFVLLILAMSRVPTRVSLYTMAFCAMTLENPAEIPASAQWKSPLFPVGGLLLNHMNTMTGVKALSFSGMDILIGALWVIVLIRRSSGSRIDSQDRIATPEPLVKLALVSLAGTAFVWFGGLLRGGDFGMSLWQVDRVVYLPVVFLLYHFGLRGPADHGALAKVLLAAATLRATAAFIIIHTVYLPPDGDGIVSILPYATSHHDSLLFAEGFILLVSLVLNRVDKKKLRVVWFAAPVLILGMISNHRRMVWVQVLLGFAVAYLLTPTNNVKRRLQKALLFASPVFAAYAALGWSSESNLFKPVKILRSVVDAQADASTMWREIENFDLISTIKENPIFGTGYGHGYHEVVPLPAVDYDLEFYLPHNSILGLWCFAGLIGFAAITMLWVVGVYFAVRAYHFTQKSVDGAAALTCVGAVLAYLVQCWGDLGLGSWTGVFTMGAALATAGKLASAVGAWDKKDAQSPRARRGFVPPQVRVE